METDGCSYVSYSNKGSLCREGVLLFDVGRASWYQTLPFVMEYELGGDRAVIIVSVLVAILSSSTSVSKDNTGTEECFCRDNLYFCAPKAVTTAKWRDVLERE